MSSTLHIHLLGDFQLLSDDTPVTTLLVPRVQSLLAYLVLHSYAPQDRSRLAFLLWPDSTEAQAHTNLRKVLYHLRQALPDVERFLAINKQSVQWISSQENARWTLDALQLEQSCKQAQQAEQHGDMATVRNALEQVVRLYRGELLPGCYDEWLLAERERIHSLFVQAAEHLSVLLEQECDYDAALLVARQLLHYEPLHEATYRRLMRLLSLQGDRASALRVYHACVTVMERELGAEPSEATKALYQSLLSSTSELPEKPVRARESASPLLGRKTEWRQLQQAWHKASEGHPHFVVLTGDAGIGKTRLAEEMEIWVSRQRFMTASARCYATSGMLAYAPVTTWLRSSAFQSGIFHLSEVQRVEIARLVPEILVNAPHLPYPGAMTERWQQQSFFEALARAVLHVRQPLLLLLDDLQWCDSETLEWLHYLLRFSQEARLLVLGTIRVGETTPGQALTTLLQALQRDSLITEIPLSPLSTAETISLAEHIVGHALTKAQGDEFYTESEGNPLFVVEMARAGTLEQRACEVARTTRSQSLLTPSTSTLPPAVQTVLVARLALLTPLAHDVANIAAVVGREFSYRVLVQVSGLDEDAVVRGLDELWQRHIVHEQETESGDTYDFSHEKLREQVYTLLSTAHRRLLHKKIAQAFEQLYASQLDAVSGQIATHYERAGLPLHAIPHYQRAGEAARRLYAHVEALAAFGRAVILLETQTSALSLGIISWEMATQVYISLGDVFLEVGRYEEVLQAYQHALAYIPVEEYLWQARLQRKIARAWNYLSPNPHDVAHSNARNAFQQAEHILTRIEDMSNPVWREEWIELHVAQIWPIRGTVDEMTATIEKLRPVVERYGTTEQRRVLIEAVGMRNMLRNRYTNSEQAIASRRASLAAVEETGDKGQIGTALFVLGTVLLLAGHLDEAQERLEQALGIAEQIDIRWLQMRCMTYLPLIFRQRGQVDRVRALLTQANAIDAAQNNSMLLGHRAWLSWRDGNSVQAETYAKASLEGQQCQQQKESNPFLWVGLWPLMGIMLVQHRTNEAINGVHVLLDPTQHPQPPELRTLLEQALQAWNSGQHAEAHRLLLQVVPLAEQKGYL